MKCADRYYSSPYYSDFEKSILQQTKMKGEELTKYETNKTIRKKIDKLLHENHLIQQEIDHNTSKEEKQRINKLSEAVLEKIKEIEPNFFTRINE